MKSTQKNKPDHRLYRKEFQQTQNKIAVIILINIAKITKHLPTVIQKPIVKTIDLIGLFIIRILTIFTLTLKSPQYLTGINKTNKKDITIKFNGFSKSDYLLDEILLKKKELNNKTKNTDLIIYKSDVFYQKYFQKRGYLIIPEYITLCLDTTASFDKLINNAAKTILLDINKAKSTDYHCEISSDPHKFAFFYYHIYRPYIEYKHQKKGRITSYATIQHLAQRKAKILFIKLHDEYIFGGIFTVEKNMIKTYYAGIMEKKYNHIHNGIMALSYYYLIKEAKKQKVSSIDFGTARPFFSDGLLSYKLKWNMNLTQTSPFFSKIYAIKINNEEKNDITLQCPFIFLKNNQLILAVHATQKKTFVTPWQQNLLKRIQNISYNNLTNLINKKNNI